MNIEEGPFRIEPCDELNREQRQKFLRAKNSIHIAEPITVIEAMIAPRQTSKIFKTMDKLFHRGAKRGQDFVIEKGHGGTSYVLHTTTRFISVYEDDI